MRRNRRSGAHEHCVDAQNIGAEEEQVAVMSWWMWLILLLGISWELDSIGSTVRELVDAVKAEEWRDGRFQKNGLNERLERISEGINSRFRISDGHGGYKDDSLLEHLKGVSDGIEKLVDRVQKLEKNTSDDRLARKILDGVEQVTYEVRQLERR